MTLERMFHLYGEARCAGRAGKEPDERADPAKGRSYKRNSSGNFGGTRKLVVALVGDRPIADLAEADFAEAFRAVHAVPAIHGKSRSETRTIREIIEETDGDEREAKHRLRLDMTSRGESPGNIEAAQHQAPVPRLGANTVYRHLQDTQRVIRCAIGMGLLDRNLMARTMGSKERPSHQETRQEGNRMSVWTPLLPRLLRTPAFHKRLEDRGEPMF